MKLFMRNSFSLLILSTLFFWGFSGCENDLPKPLEPDFVSNSAPSIDELAGSWKAVGQILVSVANPSVKDSLTIGDTLFIPGAIVQFQPNDSTLITGQLYQTQDVDFVITADGEFTLDQQNTNLVFDTAADTLLFAFPSSNFVKGAIDFQDDKYIFVVKETNFFGNPDSSFVLTGVFFVEDYTYDGTTLGLSGLNGQQVFWDFDGNGTLELAESIVNYQKQ